MHQKKKKLDYLSIQKLLKSENLILIIKLFKKK